MSRSRHPILFLSQGADFYGSNLILLEVAKHLKQQNYPIHVIFPLQGPIIEEFQKENISTEILNLAILRRQYVTFFGLVNRAYYFLKALFALILLIKKRKVGIVYSNGLGVLVGIFGAFFSGVIHVWHIHEIIGKPEYFYSVYRRLLNWQFGHNIAVSEAVKSFWAKEGSINFYKIYNGIPLPKTSPDPNKLNEELGLPPSVLVIGMIGRVSYLKGQDYFLKIAHELLKHDQNLKFVMVGDVYPGNEDLYDELNLLKESLGIQDSVIDLGYRRDIPDILAALDLFILPSTQPDSFPTVILEAMQQEKAIISTRQGGALEMLEEHVSGLFIPIHEEKEAADIILPLLQNENARKAMGIEAKKKVLRDFASEKFKEKIFATIEEIQFN
jgi:glycosyltransferase involved in cell wall biosynthesis